MKAAKALGTARPFRIVPVLLLAACAVNPATGAREFSLIGEGREVEMGREADGQVTASYGLVDDAELQAYVSELGLRLAAVSERPTLPWEFKVVDDPIVNAFALPGGFIYVTRGTLAAASTLLGLAALSLADVPALRQMALLAGSAVVGAFAGNLLWIPILLPLVLW